MEWFFYFKIAAKHVGFSNDYLSDDSAKSERMCLP